MPKKPQPPAKNADRPKRHPPKGVVPEGFKATLIPKGVSGNPNGRPALSPELKKFKNLTKKELVEVGNLVIKGDLDALRAVAKKPGATVLQIMLAAICIKVIQKGDMSTLDILLNRLVGKVRDEVHNTGNASSVVVTLPSNGREVKVS